MKKEYLEILIKLYRQEIKELTSLLKDTKYLNSILRAHKRKLKRQLIEVQKENQKLQKALIKQDEEVLKLKLKLSSYEIL